MEMAEGAVEQLHGAVDEVAAAAAGQHGAEIFHGSELANNLTPVLLVLRSTRYAKRMLYNHRLSCVGRV